MAVTVWTGFRSSSNTWYSKVIGEADDRTTSIYKFLEVPKGRGLAMRLKAEHVITREDGTIEERNSYGNDPVRSRG